MRKSITLAAITVLVVAAAYFSSCKEKKSEPLADNKEDSLQKVIARGDYLANHVAACIHCHSQRDFNKFSGPVIPGSEGGGGFVFDNKIADFIPGVLYGKNITPDNETGIGTWTDDEILRAVTQGIRKNGDTLFPLMPYANFNRMAKDDLLSIIAYLRTLKPIKNKIPDRQLMIPISMAYPGPALQASVDGNVRPPESETVKYGEYLITAADCMGCHTAFVKGKPDFSLAFAGGNLFTFPGFKVNSSNITSDSATGLGTWTEERFLTKFTVCREEAGYNFNPGTQNTVMPITEFAGMTDADLKAIYAYLKTVKPVVRSVEKYPK